ncbi:DUF2793 domain-containing protein [Sphingomonas morindae]|uniref:DUF2793 domain-containing protein n=1 Tax=Sphingomonas morindae TaxID=1541170 RepID=A0ABY4X3L2_9SPHN|nr:DUF2793 domain-containing protein [Sphingomonas morindae]USI71480.1 DUF2793 domain-containing protein [Sphingomonas morindae]
MADETPWLRLPLLAPGQAQKELFHNEALALLDGVAQLAVAGLGLTAPPAAPRPGQCWIVGAAATGEFAGQDQALAIWTEGGWRFVAARPGMTGWLIPDGLPVRFEDDRWTVGELCAKRLKIGGRQVVGMQQSAVALPSGGSNPDAEARAAISRIVTALVAHGLIAP